jgi:hypothetical protein
MKYEKLLTILDSKDLGKDVKLGPEEVIIEDKKLITYLNFITRRINHNKDIYVFYIGVIDRSTRLENETKYNQIWGVRKSDFFEGFSADLFGIFQPLQLLERKHTVITTTLDYDLTDI